MRIGSKSSLVRLVGPLFVLFVTACAPIIADYSLEGYKNATSLKARSLAMIDLSAEGYGKHSSTVEKLLVDIDAAYEFAAGTPNNQITAEQWDRIRRKDHNFVGGYVVHWKGLNGKAVSEFFRQEAKTGIGRAYDYIICLEVNKNKAASCKSVTDTSG